MSPRSRLALLLLAVASCHRNEKPQVTPVGIVKLPHKRDAIKIDGTCGEKSWEFAFRSPPFVDASGRDTPHAEVRATADDDNLYLEVYVADIDIQSKGDIVKLDVGSVHIDLMPKGATAPAGVRTAVGCDDTIDEPKDHDEEWVNEIAIPWSLLGSHDVPIRAFRIDVGHNEPPHAMAWPRSAPTILHFDPRAAK